MTEADGPNDGSAIDEDDPRVSELITEIRRARGEHLARVHPEFEWAARTDTDYMEGYVRYSSWMWNPPVERALTDRDRSIIWIVLLANRGFYMTLPKQIRKALAAGVTKQEILEVLEVAILPGGEPIMELGLHALREIEEEERADEV